MPPAQKVLVLAPHPDDESLGCGGTIKLLTQSGVSVDVLLLTRGERGQEAVGLDQPLAPEDLAQTREQEAREACRVLGVREVRFLDGHDCRLHEQPELAETLAQQLAADTYQRVFCPWHGDGHPDHRAAFRILQSSLRQWDQELSIWLYEVWTPLWPSTLVPIDGTIEAKRQAIGAHRSQLACLDYLSASVGLASYRALLCPPSKFAEAFLVMDRQELLAVA